MIRLIVSVSSPSREGPPPASPRRLARRRRSVVGDVAEDGVPPNRQPLRRRPVGRPEAVPTPIKTSPRSPKKNAAKAVSTYGTSLRPKANFVEELLRRQSYAFFRLSGEASVKSAARLPMSLPRPVESGAEHRDERTHQKASPRPGEGTRRRQNPRLDAEARQSGRKRTSTGEFLQRQILLHPGGPCRPGDFPRPGLKVAKKR